MKVHVLDTTPDLDEAVAWAEQVTAGLAAAGAEVHVVASSGRLRRYLAGRIGARPGVTFASGGGVTPVPAAQLLATTVGLATATDAVLVRGVELARDLAGRRGEVSRWVAPDDDLLAADDTTWEAVTDGADVILCIDEVERARVSARWPAASWRTHVLGSAPLQRRCRAQAPTGRPPLRGRRIAVAGHDLKFFRALVPALERAGAQVRIDPWRSHVRHDERRSRRHLDWADTVVCEWALGNAVWYAANRRRDQRLVVRLHLQELTTPFPRRIAHDAVDATVFVSGFTRDRAVAELGWTDRLHVVPNAIDTDAFDRPKLPGSSTVLGLLGFLPARKRLDRALDLVEGLRRHDDRYRLEVAGGLPWDNEWVRQRPDEQRYYEEQFDRVQRSPRLRHAVRFLGPVADVPGWFRRVGWILSPSDFESFHLAPAEGMAARSLPVLWDREGVREIFPTEHVVADTTEALQHVLHPRSATDRERHGEQARAAIVERYDHAVVAARWVALLAELQMRPDAVASPLPPALLDAGRRLPAPAKALARRTARRLGVH